MKKSLLVILLIILIFYHIYPQAISIFDFSYLFTAGIVGLGLYLYNGHPYSEIVSILGAYLIFGFFYLLTFYATFYSDSYFISNTKSQFGWTFSAYLISFVFFQIHPKGTLVNFISYILIAIIIQGIIAIIMHENPEANNFFSSLQRVDEIALEKRRLTEGDRLLGYGTAFFGAGIIYGMSLILTMYILIVKKMNMLTLIMMSGVYSFLFFVGILSARTTIIGFALSLVLLVLSMFFYKNPNKGQNLRFIAITAIFGIVGYTLSYIYFPSFADWAFEAFINYSKSGEFRTSSSDSLESMTFIPSDYKTIMFGRGGMGFFGSDVGLSRLLYYIGFPGTIAFFVFPFLLTLLCMTKDRVANIMLLLFTPYAIVLNIKGLADVNSFVYLMVFYFLHYKYFVFSSKVHQIERPDSNKFRTSV